ncbi:MAG: hypothetical protein WAU24_02570 [Chitinophagaceae bacterium]
MYKIIQTKKATYFVKNGKTVVSFDPKYTRSTTVMAEDKILNATKIIEFDNASAWQFNLDQYQAKIVDNLPANIASYSIMPRLLPDAIGKAPFDTPFYLVVHERSYYNKDKDVISGCPPCKALLNDLDDFVGEINTPENPKLLFIAHNLLWSLPNSYTKYFEELKPFVPSLYQYSPEKNKFVFVEAANADKIKEKF